MVLPYDPYGDADEGDEEGEEGEGESQQPSKRPAFAVAAHLLLLYLVNLFFFPFLDLKTSLLLAV